MHPRGTVRKLLETALQHGAETFAETRDDVQVAGAAAHVRTCWASRGSPARWRRAMQITEQLSELLRLSGGFTKNVRRLAATHNV